MLNFVEEQTGAAKIKVIGVGGGGNNLRLIIYYR